MDLRYVPLPGALVIITCPEEGCDAPAEIFDRWAFASTNGPVVHVRTRCLEGHHLTPRVEHLLAAEASAQWRWDAAA